MAKKIEKRKTLSKNIIKKLASLDKKYVNKKGSSLILAIVAISLIAILSTLVLSISLTAYKASVQNKWADEDFYYCEECLKDVHGTVVSITNDIFLDNYKQVLTLFTGSTPDIINKTFREKIRLDLNSNETNQGGALYKALNKEIDALDDAGKVIGKLKVFYNETRYRDNPDLMLEDFKNGKYVFKDVNVEFYNLSRTAQGVNQEKFYSSITTDIVIYIPDLVPAVETDTKGSLDYVIVTGGNLAFNGNVTVNGNVYAGEDLEVGSDAILGMSSNVKFLSDYITVCNQIKNKGNLAITGSSATASIWCKDFLLDNDGSSATVAGNLFVNDDLEINGKNCSVALSGKYYGFGDGTSNTENTQSNGGASSSMNSAILVNGEGTLLDMMSIDELVISGHSFFPVDGVNKYTGAESLATIVSQSIYMVDDSYIDFKNRKVSIDTSTSTKSIDFSEIKTINDKTLVDLLLDGYTLVTGGVDLDKANIKVDGEVITEAVFAEDYIESQEKMVTLGFYETNGEKYCSLYWNFQKGDEIKEQKADIISSSYFDLSTLYVKLGSLRVNVADLVLTHNGEDFSLWFKKNAQTNQNELKKIDLEMISSSGFTVADAHDYIYNFSMEFGNDLPSGSNVSEFIESLDQDEPVKAVIVGVNSDTEGVFNYNLYLQWNFENSKVTQKNPGEAFISACINSGLVNGFLEKFMDGGYIKISPDASVSTVADLYEYLVNENGYVADKFNPSNGSIFNSSLFAENFANSYKWYMTTLIPEKYDPFGILAPFDNNFDNGDEYSVFNRKSYYYSSSGEKQDSKYVNFKVIEDNGVTGSFLLASTDGKYKNLIINGKLEVVGGRWTVDGIEIAPLYEGMIFVNGDVNITESINFRGMIISNGLASITSGNYVADKSLVEGCLEVLKRDINPEWWSLVSDEFFRRKTDVNTGTSSLNALDCIKYENWTRNRDKK